MSSYTIAPIVANGDPIGAVVIFSKEQALGEVEHKAVETAYQFFGETNGAVGLITIIEIRKRRKSGSYTSAVLFHIHMCSLSVRPLGL